MHAASLILATRHCLTSCWLSFVRREEWYAALFTVNYTSCLRTGGSQTVVKQRIGCVVILLILAQKRLEKNYKTIVNSRCHSIFYCTIICILLLSGKG